MELPRITIPRDSTYVRASALILEALEMERGKRVFVPKVLNRLQRLFNSNTQAAIAILVDLPGLLPKYDELHSNQWKKVFLHAIIHRSPRVVEFLQDTLPPDFTSEETTVVYTMWEGEAPRLYDMDEMVIHLSSIGGLYDEVLTLGEIFRRFGPLETRLAGFVYREEDRF